MNRLLIILVIFFSQASCEGSSGKKEVKQQTETESTSKPIIIQTENCESCESCVTVSNSIESDKDNNSLLSMYLYSSLVGGYDCKELEGAASKVFQLPSFKSTILAFFNPDQFDADVEIQGNASLVLENKNELVYRVKDIDVLHEIADNLLLIDNTLGLEALWQNGSLDKLENYDGYLSRIDTTNFFVLADQIAFLHNINEPDKRDELLKKAKSIEGFEDQRQALQQLLESGSFDMMTFKEAVYGGM